MSKARWWAYTFLAFAVAAGLASLGAWQLRRAEFKSELLARVASAETAPAEPLERANMQAFRKVLVNGTWVSDRLLALDNQLQRGQPGIRWYAPLKTSMGATVLVDLGWQSRPDRSVALAPPPLPSGELRGVLLPPPGAGMALGDDGQGWPRLVTRLDLAALEPSFDTPLLNLVLELEGTQTPSVRAELLPPERHRGYAVQWFGLSITVLIIYGVLAWRARRKTFPQ